MIQSPFRQFRNGLDQVQQDVNEVLNEARAFAEVLAMKQNSIEFDENGYFFVTSAGSLEEVIGVMQKQLEKLQRIKTQKDNQR
jgi:hypothetical protein